MIEEFANQHGLDPQVTESILKGTMRKLLAMYDGDAERLVADIQESPEIVECGVKRYIDIMQQMTTRALTREKEFASYVYQLLVNGGG